jgi:hypothetical protein
MINNSVVHSGMQIRLRLQKEENREKIKEKTM